MRRLLPLALVLVFATTAHAEVPAQLAYAARVARDTGDPGMLWRAIRSHADFTLTGDEVRELIRPLGRVDALDMDTLFFHYVTGLTKRGSVVTIDRKQESAFQVQRPKKEGDTLDDRIFWFYVGKQVRFDLDPDPKGITLHASGLRYRHVFDDPDKRIKVRSFRFERSAGGKTLWTTELGLVPLLGERLLVELERPAPPPAPAPAPKPAPVPSVTPGLVGSVPKSSPPR